MGKCCYLGKKYYEDDAKLKQDQFKKDQQIEKDNEEEIDKKIREELHKTVDTVFPPIPIDMLPFN